jgi:hypothetical protein
MSQYPNTDYRVYIKLRVASIFVATTGTPHNLTNSNHFSTKPNWVNTNGGLNNTGTQKIAHK